MAGRLSTGGAFPERDCRRSLVVNVPCVYVNVEPAQAMREDVETAMRAILGALASWAADELGDGSLDEEWPGILAKHGPAGALGEALARWFEVDAKPLLFVDEIDSLVGDTLLSALRLSAERGVVRRAGRTRLPHPFQRGAGRDRRGQRLQRVILFLKNRKDVSHDIVLVVRLSRVSTVQRLGHTAVFQKHMKTKNAKAWDAWDRGDVHGFLTEVLERLYTMRNQVFHGGATYRRGEGERANQRRR